ncbi:MAG: pyridoxamine 5'-phosphate oxidase [Geobacteraceae bacterium GWC2_58_44]|nr:MAG: pyridoxamine 5'-phosphate oxidase [Geobacteraceae bacterium GWC2_58_44]HBG08084.1 pyridoxamine 5'-phosphate oxidase [Geobacter sp.]
MKLAELFPEGGRGIIGTSDAGGVVNQAVFAIPHVIDEETVAWGFTEGRSIANLRLNPHASYLYLAPTRGYSGWRLTLTLKQVTEEGELLERIKEQAAQSSGTMAGAAVKQVAYFKVDEVRPLM